jgi:hypothetical protein
MTAGDPSHTNTQLLESRFKSFTLKSQPYTLIHDLCPVLPTYPTPEAGVAYLS